MRVIQAEKEGSAGRQREGGGAKGSQADLLFHRQLAVIEHKVHLIVLRRIRKRQRWLGLRLRRLWRRLHCKLLRSMA